MTIFDWLASDLVPGRVIQLSMYPDIPGRDESISHKVLDSRFEETRSGKLITIRLENCETKETYTYVYPDVVKVEMPSDFKYYLYSINRSTLADFELEKTTELLNSKQNVDDYDFYRNAPTYINRILIMK